MTTAISYSISILSCFQISKSNVVDDMVESNSILYEPGEKPDHCVVIKYVPYVGELQKIVQIACFFISAEEITNNFISRGQ